MLSIFLAFVMSFTSMTSALQSTDYELNHDWMDGPGMDVLEIEGTPDEYGLIWIVNEPDRDFEEWLVMVYNASDKTVSDLKITLEYMVDGQWYLANMRASDRYMMPFTIPPEGLGFLEMGNVMASSPLWTDVRVQVNDMAIGSSELAVPLTFEEVSITRRGYEASVTNPSDQVVSDIALVSACIEDGELIRFEAPVSDILKLNPGAQEDLKFAADGCDDVDQTVLSAFGMKR